MAMFKVSHFHSLHTKFLTQNSAEVLQNGNMSSMLLYTTAAP